jgi:hypothetical protein
MSCSHHLKSYLTNTLVETGTGKGDAVALALQFGFKEVHSVELHRGRYEFCLRRFADFPNVHLACGESVAWLRAVVGKLKERSTFLLDAHVLSLEEVHAEIVCPVLQELEIVLESGKRLGTHHFILIDDLFLFDGTVREFGFIGRRDIEAVVARVDSTATVVYSRKFVLIR